MCSAHRVNSIEAHASQTTRARAYTCDFACLHTFDPRVAKLFADSIGTVAKPCPATTAATGFARLEYGAAFGTYGRRQGRDCFCHPVKDARTMYVTHTEAITSYLAVLCVTGCITCVLSGARLARAGFPRSVVGNAQNHPASIRL